MLELLLIIQEIDIFELVLCFEVVFVITSYDVVHLVLPSSLHNTEDDYSND